MFLTFTGHSDDIVSYALGLTTEKDDLKISEEECYVDSEQTSHFLVHSKEGRCNVYAVYDGCWSFAVSKVDESDGELFPQHRSWEKYSEVLRLEVPEGSKVSFMGAAS